MWLAAASLPFHLQFCGSFGSLLPFPGDADADAAVQWQRELILSATAIRSTES